VLGALAFDAKGSLGATSAAPGDALPKGIRPLSGPNAGALAEGRGAWAGPGYVEARLLDSRAGLWAFLSGSLGGPLVSRPLGAVPPSSLRRSSSSRVVTRARRSFARSPTCTRSSATFAWQSAPAARGSSAELAPRARRRPAARRRASFT
jgi:hypothetical protein